MSREHTLKCAQPFFQDILDGRKTFELRYNDRGYQTGDTLLLKELQPNSETLHTSRQIRVLVKYILSGWSLREGHVALGIVVIDPTGGTASDE